MRKYVYSGISEQSLAADRRLADARRLSQTGGWVGAMYLAGYAVECKLKSKLMEKYGCFTLEELETELSRRTNKQVDLAIHNLDVLFSYFQAQLDRQMRITRSLVHRWSVNWRYKPEAGNQKECDQFLEAVTDFTRYIDRSVY